MEQPVLAFHKSPKRKRHDIEASDAPPASFVTPRSGVNEHENYPRDDVSIGRNSLPGVVAGKLRDLDIHTTPSPDYPLVCFNNEGDTPQRQETYKGDIQDPSKNDRVASTKTSTPHNNEGTESSPGGECRLPLVTALSQNEKEAVEQQTLPPRYKSPPLLTKPGENPLTWRDSEITGHNPTDPNDDGYGMNGIGFQPSAAVAWDRAQRRKKQIAEWNKRESREARDRRRERRDGAVLERDNPTENQNQKRVKFDT